MNSHLFGQGKSIVFCGVLNIDILIIEELRNYGFDVISINEELEKKYIFHYPNIRSFLYAKYRKIIFHDKEASRKAKYQFRRQKFLDIVKDKKLDYALFFRGDLFDDELLKVIKNKTTYGMINYQFDGLHRYPDIYSKINIFDRFFVFDYQDLYRYPDLLPTTNFYFEPHSELSNNGKIYFLAVHHDSRTHLINQFTAYAKRHHLSLDFNIVFATNEQKDDYKTPEVIDFLDKVISFNDNIVRSQQSSVLADFVINEHKGLSFRVFEAIGYQKKLITTNETVKFYDFYHPNNIFIYNGENHNELTKFLKLPYFPIDENIRQKYSFNNWIRYVLDISPYQKIELPEY
ncbi:MAG: hypothetical protein IJV35_08025 [Neisseriaceae bacterium]|nr:hypothetical protein [Neisseriaceae bacterium]